ncbi:Nhe3 [Cordylochernes scorpioides]|uniref:Nhe3 n=1 Tax=Cordylochernes scorpioides TaxID=51811 RepID=A0ABY6KFS0_9ARAC|nr:Nhe3 [Cordylochernes scorpioides]
MSYSTFLMAEAADLTGIVAVLFCGICQAHYTFNNLSEESRLRTKQLFELLNFLAENFIFTYIGVSMFTYSKHCWDAGFISVAFVSFPGLSLYIRSVVAARTPSLPATAQCCGTGLRGAIAFALAIRNTVSESRQLILTTTSVIVIVTVVLCGGFTTQVLAWLGIPCTKHDLWERPLLIIKQLEEHELMEFV